MARDYKNRAAGKNAHKRAPVWIWLVIGYVFGGFSVGLVWWSQAPPISQAVSWIGTKPKSVHPAVPVSEPETSKPEKIDPPHFDFYSLLPELEVVVPDAELEGKKSKSTQDKVTKVEPKPVPKSGYLIQVSSFRSARDADRLKAELAMLGLHAQISKASIKGAAWHRVRVGPYNSTQAVQRGRQQLASNGHNTMVIKIRP